MSEKSNSTPDFVKIEAYIAYQKVNLVYKEKFEIENIAPDLTFIERLAEGEGGWVAPWNLTDRGLETRVVVEKRAKNSIKMPVRKKNGEIEVNLNFEYSGEKYNWGSDNPKIAEAISLLSNK